MGSLLRYLVIFILVFFLLRFVWYLARRLFGVNRAAFAAQNNASSQGTSATGQTFRDPVCGTFISDELSHKLLRDAETLHFCSPECRTKYEEGKGK